MCQECKHINSPLQRYCDMCWKLRAGWLPDIPSSATRDVENQSNCGAKYSNKTGSHIHDAKYSNKTDRQVNDSAKVDSSSRIFQDIKGSMTDLVDFDSGISCLSSSFPSSQETVTSSHETPLPTSQKSEEKVSDKDVCLDSVFTDSKEGSLFHEAQASEVRYSLSNFQRSKSSSVESLQRSKSSSVESLESQKADNNASSLKPSSVSDPCMICLSKPKSASLVHGSSGHQVCCFPCAKRLKRRGKVCPVCRRPIQKVIKNYIL